VSAEDGQCRGSKEQVDQLTDKSCYIFAQALLIRQPLDDNYDMVIDDDGKGGPADVVSTKLIGDAAAPSYR
jgi:hypothetical protein